ncbi:hypothetical protein ABOM_004744 [Aspergillus bombycis]|uniref:Uncharacterized protein n=1 Tax=Aspergillus bombycis TaxID=109264 RepID=A0A1F8A3W0_9EURO|nr:hypothetical protein ABOM_004744 [Aspergillus bombycis]OGM46404.1 hypothetical protein ABOM_004744 [Aspergillus bombycis]
MLHDARHILEVVEINYPAGFAQAWLKQVAVLEGYVEERTLLSYAARRGSEAVIQLLHETNKCASNFKTESGLASLTLAAENGHEAVVKLLLERGTDIGEHGFNWTLLEHAAKNGHEGVVKLLLQKGINLDSRFYANGNLYTLLSYAARIGNVAAVQLLLERGADPNSKSCSSDRTPLLVAVWVRHESVVKLLLKNGAYIQSKSYDGQTSLSLAAERGDTAMVKALLKN